MKLVALAMVLAACVLTTFAQTSKPKKVFMITDMEKVKTSRPDNSEPRAMLGEIYSQLGEKPKAIKEYGETIRLAPDRQDLRQGLQKVRDGESNPGRRSQP
jgi:cytochrome c-type biogenesis protein CcmH/NrfG